MKFIDKLYFASIDHFINWRKHLKEYFIAILIALILRTFIGIYQIPTGSMIPTLKVGDVLIGNRFHFGYKLPFTAGLEGFRLPAIRPIRIGDVVIFRSPPEHDYFVLKATVSTSEELHYLQYLNTQAASFQPPINVVEQLTNYIFISIPYHLYQQEIYPLFPIKENIFKNSINFNDSLSPFLVNVYLSKKYYEKQIEEIKNTINIVSQKKYFKKNLTTYHQDSYKGLGFYLTSGPLAVISILANSILNTPFFFYIP